MTDESPRWRRYLRFWREDSVADVDEELRFHIESRVADLVAHGMTPEQARREAVDRFGNVDDITKTLHTLSEEREQAMQRSEWMHSMAQDLRYAIRQLLKSPALAIIAIITIALGIGANSAIFSVVNAVLLRPLPYAHSDRLMLLSERYPGGVDGNVSVGNFTDWRARSRSFEAMSAEAGETVNLTGNGEPVRLSGARVTASFFRTGYMRPELGRYFLEEEDQPGAPHVVVLSHPLWTTRFATDPAIVGKSVELNGERYTVIGITPKEYSLTPDDEQLWTPAAFTAEQINEHDEHALSVFGLLKPGVTLEAAQRELSAIEKDLHDRYPRTGTPTDAGVASLRTLLIRDYRTQLLVLLGAVGFVLLIACGNVANLLLARASSRQKEIAIRSALGAGRARIVRQLLTESLVLALVGGAAGLVIAHFGIRFLVTMSPPGVPRLGEASLSGGVLGFTVLVTLGCGIVFGLVPAVRAARADLQGTLKEGGKGSAMGASRDRLRSLLVVTEVAVALVLLVGAGLLVRSAVLLQAVKPGFDPSGVLSFRIALPKERYGDPERARQGFDRILEQVTALPGVRSAAITSTAPFGGGGQNGLLVEGRPFDDKNVIMSTLRMTTPRYFETMRVPVLHGRIFNDRDIAGNPKVMMINETLAKAAFPGGDAIGKRIACCEGGPNREPSWKEVIGVVGDVRAWGLGNEIRPEFYLPIPQAPAASWNWIDRSMTIVARTAGDPASLTKAAQRAVWSVDPTLPLYQVRTLTEAMERTTASTRFNMLLLTMLGATGLVLAAVGIYGVIGYFVSQRTHEIGIRMALGASATNVQGMVVRQGALLALAGVALGLIASLALMRALATLLFGVTPRDPVTLVGVGALLAAVAIVASYIPARRATKVDPLSALRSG
ncbi:MAG: ABC transporter permease [Gemmatimonadota bacterium]|nr:ABC transporter permease [Gemmatimonadota bacterium]